MEAVIYYHSNVWGKFCKTNKKTRIKTFMMVYIIYILFQINCCCCFELYIPHYLVTLHYLFIYLVIDSNWSILIFCSIFLHNDH